MVPIARVHEIAALDGVVATSPFLWYVGKYKDEIIPFAQFGVDADTVFTVRDELSIPPDQLKAFQQDKAGCVIGRKLADEPRASRSATRCRSRATSTRST